MVKRLFFRADGREGTKGSNLAWALFLSQTEHYDSDILFLCVRVFGKSRYV